MEAWGATFPKVPPTGAARVRADGVWAMRIMIVGGTGTIGGAVAEALESRGHSVVRVGHSDGDATVDLTDRDSIEELYAGVGDLDAVVCCAGVAAFGPLREIDDADYERSISSKLMGQVNLVRAGLERLPAGGSFTLTSGTLSQEPEPGTVAVAMVGAAVEAWVKAAALDLDEHRVNVVSPDAVAESLAARGEDPSEGTPVAEVARVYVRAIEGDMSGQTLYARS